MIRRILLLSVLIVGSISAAQAQVGTGTLIGTVTDESTKEPIPFANIVVFQAGQQVTGTTTDFDGKYKIAALKPANDYVVKASVVGFTAQEKRGVVVKSGQNNFVDFKMSAGVKLDEVVIIDYEVPLIEKDGGSSVTVSGDDIQRMPSRGAAAAVTTAAGVQDNDGAIGSVRGTRSGSTYTYIDGVKVRGSSTLPQSAIAQVKIETGGVSAQYGDATGGIISITTKGAAKEISGSMEVVSSGGIRYNDQNQFLLDQQGYNLGALSLTGPLISIKDKKDPEKKRPIVGFFLAGEASYIEDSRPSAIGNYYVKSDVLRDLEVNPIQQSPQGGSILRSELIRKSDLEWTAQRKNTRTRRINASGNLDFYLTPSISLKVGGTVDINDRKLYSYNGSMFNFSNNGRLADRTWRVYGRFTQRFNDQSAGDGEGRKKSAVSNAFYSIQADYENFSRRTMDEDHKDDLFKYGYVGKFTTYREPTYQLGIDEATGLFGFLQGPYNDTLVTFEASDINPNLSAYTAQYYDQNPNPTGKYENLTQIDQDRGALRNGDVPRSVYGLWDNTGTPYNSNTRLEQTQFRVMATGSFDIKNHSISLGFEYEQRKDSYVGYAPRGLWTITRQYANNHFRDVLDLENPLVQFDANGVFTDTINYNPLVTPDPNGGPMAVGQYYIDYNIRQALGLPTDGTDFLDIDSYDPEFFDISWFAPDELLNNGNNYVSYYGFDHTGARVRSKPTFDDFFTEKDEYGNFTRRIGAFEPIYIAGYIQDEFTFKDLIFRVGVRVDRYDANQKVLKDPFLFREARTVAESPTIGNNPHVAPSNIPSTAIVYVNSVENPTAAVGYRDGNVWYNAAGVEVSDPSVLRTGTGIAPYLFNPPSNDPITGEPEPVTSSGAFKDYEPQVNVMPRISFSFPISENALFYANYDVLTQRPLTGNRLDLIDYLFIQNNNNRVNNPDLKPETTIEYAIGFKQKISKRSAVEINGFYREMRDQIATIRVSEAYPRTYTTFGNLDFGTVKGLTVTYDLRRTKNLQMRLAYTLQFADGTGSSVETGVNLVNAGFPNLRVIQPLDFDQRHNIVLSADYRFAGGKDYNGPKTTTKSGKTINWLENFGVNAIIRAGSGNPFSRQSNIQPTAINDGDSDNMGSGFLEGSVNGSNKPWQFRIDMRVDRDFLIKWNKGKEGKPAKTSYLNVYVDVQNLLGTKNVLNVYRATGNPDDDGYLLAQQSQAAIESQTDEQSFRDLYAVKVNRPSNYSLPRRIRLGVMLNF